MSTTVKCRCGYSLEKEFLPFTCPKKGTDDTDHVVVRYLEPKKLPDWNFTDESIFVRYRNRFHSYYNALKAGFTDQQYVELVKTLDDNIAKLDGTGFRATPVSTEQDLGTACGFQGKLWVKNETINVSGSHKARHLMGIAIHLDAANVPKTKPLTIASCGNAALAAAVVAKAAQRPLEVQIPPDANPNVIARLEKLDSKIHLRYRLDGIGGDPCYHAFLEDVKNGFLPFTCQGPDNGMTIEGGQTLAYELVEQMRGNKIDRLFIQVGGGALASACIAGLQEALESGEIESLPKIHLVQTEGAWPMYRAYNIIIKRITERLGLTGSIATKANKIKAAFKSHQVTEELKWSLTNRSRVMWPWESIPHSVAHGILDDETYDWYAAILGMIQSGGWPIIVSEEQLNEANTLALTHTNIKVDHTGTAGLAGAIALKDQIKNENICLLFTGKDRN